MGNLDYREFSRRRRPHFNPPDGTFFLTFRLAGSIPKAIVREYKARFQWLQDHLKRVQRLTKSDASQELTNWRTRAEALNREWFIKTEEILHRADHGPIWMSNADVADKVAENLHRLDGTAYRLDAYSIMSNHAHTVFKPFLSEIDFSTVLAEEGLLLINEHPGLSKIMHSLKGRSARECNLLLERKGSFWEHESFDHAIREGKFDKTVRYVLDNPVKVGLVQDWADWRWSFCRKELVERFRKK